MGLRTFLTRNFFTPKMTGALALSWTDSIDMENRIVHVNRSFSDRPDEFGECKKRIQTTKTDAGTRDIPMVQEVFDAFLMEYEFQKILGFWNEEIDGFKDFIFISSNQNVLLPGAVNRAIHSAVDWYNEHEVAAAADEGREPFLLPEEITCHILRHTFCTRLCENESNIKVIQSLMGHRDITTTMNIYADATKEKKQETKDVLLELRTKNNLSQDDLAEKVFVTRQAVSRWENGDTVPNTETLKLLL